MYQNVLTIKAGVDPRRMARSGICILLILALLTVIVVPAHAIALTTGIAIATVGALVLAACGVVLTAPTGQSLTDYIGGQIDSYAVSQGYSNRSTWLNGVTQQTVTSSSIWSILDGAVKIPGGIYNALTTWAGSYIEDNNVVSNGQPVGQVGSSAVVDVGLVSASGVGSGAASPITIYGAGSAFSGSYFFNDTNAGISGKYTQYDVSSPFMLLVVDTSKVTNPVQFQTNIQLANVSICYTNTIPVANSTMPYYSRQSASVGQNINLSTTYKYAVFGLYYSSLKVNTQYYVRLAGGVTTPSGTVITPTARVVDPPVAGTGQDAIIRGLPVTSSMTPEAAADAIQDQATTSAGITATSTLDGEAVPEGSEWLYDQLDGMPKSIGQSIADLFVPSDGFWSEYVDSIQGVFDQRMGLLTYPISVIADLIERIVDLDDVEPIIRWNDISWRGQVVIPGGSYNFNDLLEDESIETMYNIYRVVVSGLLILAFLHLCRRKLEEIETK